MAVDSIPFDVNVVSEDTHLESSFEEIRILFVAEGSCRLKGNAITVDLGKSDYLLINIFEEAQLRIPEGSYVAILSIPYEELLNYTGSRLAKFRMCSLDGSSGKYAEMRYELLGLIMCFMGDRKSERLKAIGLYYMVLQSLLTDFRIQTEDEAGKESKEELIGELLQYVLSNYRSELTVTDIADTFFLSRSQASRMIRQYTGKNFPDFLKELRLKSVRKELEYTDRSVTEIAMSCGFSSLSVLNRTFREVYRMTPTEYRTAFREGKADQTDIIDEQEISRREALFEMLREDMADNNPANGESELVKFSLQDAMPWKGWKNRVLNVGTFTSFLSARMQQQVVFLKERLNLEYVRTWNPVFSPGSMFYNKETGVCNFTVVDEVLDFLADQQLKVFIDLTPRRERNMASEQREITGESSRQLFETLEEWLTFTEAFISHLKERYREETVRSWIIEMSFFINDIPFYTKDYDPKKLWNRTAALVKELIPGIRIAGPGLLPEPGMDVDEQHIRQFLEGCEIMPDIFTSIHFPYQGQRENIYSGMGYVRNARRFYFEEEVGRIRRCLTLTGFAGEYWVTEHGISIANRNYLQDSTYRGVQLLEDQLKTRNETDSIGIFYASDLIGDYSDAGSVLSGSGGILSRSGIRKPAYYTYRFLRQLGDRLLAETSDLIATCFSTSDIRILTWNKKYPGPKYYISEENSFRPDELPGLFENLDPRRLKIQISGLEEGRKYRIRQRTLNQEHGSILDKWIKLGGNRDLSRDDQEYLSLTSVPEVTAAEMISESGMLELELVLEANELRMIQITAVK